MSSKPWLWTLLLVAGCSAAAATVPTPQTAEEAASAEIDNGEVDQEEVPEAHAGAPRASAIEMLGISGPDRPWEEMSSTEREWYMVGKVQPIMWEVFRGHSEARYEQFSCDTCHGEDGKERGYAMPSPSLPLPMGGSYEFNQLLDTRIGRFMSEKVSPITAKLMGKPAYDPATGQGFGCFDCHVKE